MRTNHTSPKKTAMIIGAGLAGLVLATELADKGYVVTLLEKDTHLGGRASNGWDIKMHDPVPIGPHVFVIVYDKFRRFLKKIRAEEAISWERKNFLEIVHQKRHHRITFSRIPDPFSVLPSLLSYPFMTWRDKISHIRLAVHTLTASHEDAEQLDRINAYEHLRALGVTQNAINMFWRFFALSLLNVPIERCSAAEPTPRPQSEHSSFLLSPRHSALFLSAILLERFVWSHIPQTLHVAIIDLSFNAPNEAF